MTEANHSILYLAREDYRHIHALLATWAEHQGEPIPPFALAQSIDLEALVMLPQGLFYGQSAYPTLEEKAAIIFYSINKRQIFLNGNKRMSTLSLLVFLGINHKQLNVSPDELTAKALWLANTPSLDFPTIKDELVRWIREHVIDEPKR
jgi:death-on-curing protein